MCRIGIGQNFFSIFTKEDIKGEDIINLFCSHLYLNQFHRQGRKIIQVNACAFFPCFEANRDALCCILFLVVRRHEEPIKGINNQNIQ